MCPPEILCYTVANFLEKFTPLSYHCIFLGLENQVTRFSKELIEMELLQFQKLGP